MLVFLGWAVLLAISVIMAFLSLVVLSFSSCSSSRVAVEDYLIWGITAVLWYTTITSAPFSITFTG